MLAQGIYTKEEIAKEFNISASKAVNITRKLTQLRYEFKTSGKGTTYRIEITKLPGVSIGEFAEQYLGIAARLEDKLAHFLYLLFALDDGFNAERTATSLEWSTYASRNTIYKWLEALVNCGLLIKKDMEPLYYAASPRIILTTSEETEDYTYTKKFKRITLEEYERAMEAERRIQAWADREENYLEYAADELKWEKEKANKDTLDKWWALSKGRVEINKGWPHYTKLMELLSNYDYKEYEYSRNGNFEKDRIAWEERVASWEAEKAEKRAKAEAKKAEMEARLQKREQEEQEKKDYVLDTYELTIEKPKVKEVSEWAQFICNNVKMIKGNASKKVRDKNEMRMGLLIADEMFAQEDMIPFLKIYAGCAQNSPGNVELMMDIIRKDWLVDICIKDGILRIHDAAISADWYSEAIALEEQRIEMAFC